MRPKLVGDTKQPAFERKTAKRRAGKKRRLRGKKKKKEKERGGGKKWLFTGRY